MFKVYEETMAATKVKAHVIVTPLAAQGHVAPLMKLAYRLAENGIKVTFATADYIHDQIVSSMPENFKDSVPISLVPVPTSHREAKDGLELVKTELKDMPGNLQRLIEQVNRENEDERVVCIVTDTAAWWSIEIGNRMGIKVATVVPFGAGNLAFDLHAPKLVESGIIDVNGFPVKDDELIDVSKETLPWSTKELTWIMPDAPETQEFAFKNFILKNTENVKNSNWVLVNSFYELEKWAFDSIPKALPIGPLTLSSQNQQPFPGNFWEEDSSCLNWLDQQPENSVIYAAFGSTVVCNLQQFHEFAYAFELIGRPFLWVFRPNLTEAAEFPQGFIERVASYGKIVDWAPQEKVLSHRAIACFFSHCGWNSTIEGVSNGVPFLCWPYFTDQFRNCRIICESWKIGVRVFPDENGVVTRHEIKSKMEKLLSCQDIKGNSIKLTEMAAKSVAQGGSSFNNLMSFIEDITS